MNKLKAYLSTQFAKHLLFWAGVLLYFIVTANYNFNDSYQQVIEFNLMVVFTQAVTAYTCLFVLIPKFLDKKKYLSFAFLLLVLLFAMFAVYNLFKMVYYDPKYYDTFNDLGKFYAKESFLSRQLSIRTFVTKIIKMLAPTVLLLIATFYKNQQELSQLKEQKKTAELSALKNQLNPHFLFNTLNNLYSLALEKSEKTPEVIERLSDILDYTLYGCKDKYVTLDKEIELIENYLALQKIRYGKRIDVSFKTEVKKGTQIAPLILLTFVENAFKHGVKEELKQAEISISLVTKGNQIVFKISNTKPGTDFLPDAEKLGLKNVRMQLELLYPKTHFLEISDTENKYTLTLSLNEA